VRHFLQGRPEKGIYQIHVHPANISITFHHTIWAEGVPADDVWPQKCRQHLLAVCGQGAQQSGLHFCLPGGSHIASRSEEEHIQHLRILPQRLSNASLVIYREKYVFGVAEVKFLGHHLTAAGTSPTAAHLEAIQLHPRPTTVKELQDFLGTVNFFNFYLRFVPVMARITDVLHGSPGPAVILDWSREMYAASRLPKPGLLFSSCRAGSDGGHVSSAENTSDHCPSTTCFFSKKLEPAQTRYSALDRELWACFSDIRHFRHMLEGRQFILFTDYKPLTQALFRTWQLKTSPATSAKL
jgi:hypothetical protein